MGTLNGLIKLQEVIELVREDWPEMPAQTMAVFIAVATAENQELTQQEIQEQVQLAQSTLSKNVAYLCEWRKFQVKGLGWLEQFPNPMNRRQRLVRLTKLGKRKAERINAVLDCK